ncbi:MAG: hypothetical protein OXM55_05660 [Bdellovibrionales bacterium]|nr:hypothetical protein [Bdellovibrionales bacterium]
MKCIFPFFLFFFFLISCSDEEHDIWDPDDPRNVPKNCPLQPERKCPEYFKRVGKASLLLVEAKDSYVKKRERFRIDNTYNHDLLNEMLKEEETLNKCLEITPIGNKGERREFFAKMNNSNLRAVNETDRSFQDKLADHYLHHANCFKEAEIKLQRLIDKQ